MDSDNIGSTLRAVPAAASYSKNADDGADRPLRLLGDDLTPIKPASWIALTGVST